MLLVSNPPSPADAEVPKAYLKYFIFNREMQMTQHGHELLDETALNNWQKLELEIPIQTNGYIYIYVANESISDVNVHFDDMEVILIESPATNASDYYPFGLVMPARRNGVKEGKAGVGAASRTVSDTRGNSQKRMRRLGGMLLNYGCLIPWWEGG